MVEIVNIVAAGDLERELALDQVVQDLEVRDKEYTPEVKPGLHLRFEDDGPLVTLYRSGSYVIMGAKTHEAVSEAFSQLQDSLLQIEIDINSEVFAPTVRYMVCKGNLEREVNLSTLAVGLNLENIEYEPEQSPFLYYWPEECECVLSIPANGQVVVTGARTKEEAENAFHLLQEKIDALF